MLVRCHISLSKPSSTLNFTRQKHNKGGGKQLSNPSLYISIIGSLQCETITRPNITYSANKSS